TRPDNYTPLMRQKIDELATEIGEANLDDIHKAYFTWFLAQKSENPDAPIFDTSRYHIEKYIIRRKMELAGATSLCPDVVTAARRTKMAAVLSSGAQASTPAIPASTRRLIPQPTEVPKPPVVQPTTPATSSAQCTGIKCGRCHKVRT
ncbi:hypothetical protein FOZ63_023612, partial [Perkinsus olseni]